MGSYAINALTGKFDRIGTASSGGGDVSGPVSSTDRSIATWSGTGGDTLRDNPTAKIDSVGRMTNTAQPAWQVYLSANIPNITGNNELFHIPFDTVDFDQGGNYDVPTSNYVFPVSGIYQINFLYFIYSSTPGTTPNLFLGETVINGVTTLRLLDLDSQSLGLIAWGEFMMPVSFIYKATAGDTMGMYVRCFGAGDANTGVSGTALGCRFSGFLVA